MTSFGVFVFVKCISRINVCASSAKESKVMASVVLHGVRVLFLVLTLTQCFLLASYPARYSNDPFWYAAAFFYTPSIILWLILVFGDAANVRLSFCVWALYVVVGLIPNIGIVFGVAGNGLIFNNSNGAKSAAPNGTNASSETGIVFGITGNGTIFNKTSPNATRAAPKGTNASSGAGILFGVTGNGTIFNKTANAKRAASNGTNASSEAGDGLENKRLDPIVLKAALCLTPLLLVLLLNTASDADDYRDALSKLCVQLAVDLLDAVEMIDIGLEDHEQKFCISDEFGIAMITVACISLFLSPWSMLEINLDEKKTKKRTAMARNIVETFCVNIVFLGIRLAIVILYRKDETIFIAKNILAIVLSSLEIRDIRKSKEDKYV